jgi:ABC-2 type transport system permease protein
MTGALLYLRLTSLQGQVRSRLRRLRQPKYLLSGIVGAAYLYFFFVRRVSPRHGHEAAVPADVLPLIAALGSLSLLTIVALSWILPRARAGLVFSEAEIAFLFPAPISRRTLIHYKLLGSQLALAFSALVLTLFSNRWSFLGGNAAIHGVGWWLILATLSLHLTGSSFVITRLLDRGVTSLRRRLVALSLIALVIFASIAWTWINAPTPEARDLTSFAAMFRYLSMLLTSGPLPWLLAVPKLVIAPFLAPDLRGFALALGPALLVLGAHYAWILRSEVAFEEASVAKAEKRTARLSAIQQGRWRASVESRKARREPFRLLAAGRPEIAFLWKNLLSTHSFFRPRTALVAAAVIAVGCTWLVGHPTHPAMRTMVGGIAVIAAGFMLLLGPQMARQDLCADLPNADILKTYPLRGWQIVSGELLTSVGILTAFVWLALLAAVLALPTEGIAVSIAVLTPPFCALQLLVPNSVAVLFPAWTQEVSNRGEHGLDVMGQRIIFLVGQMFLTVVLVLPPSIGAAVLYFTMRWLVGALPAAVVALIAMLAILIGEVWIGVRWLGGRFERFDLSSELRP